MAGANVKKWDPNAAPDAKWEADQLQPSVVHFIWSGSGTGNAVSEGANPADLKNGTYGADLSGIPTGLIYWVVNGAWVATGATVANFHGG